VTNRVAEGKGGARSNGRAGGAAHARTEADRRGSERRPGARVTDVRMRRQEEARPGGRVAALVKASPALDAATSAEAREAAMEVWNEGVFVCARRAPRVSAGVGDAGADAGLAM
jgi:hypothetical protein